MCRCGQLSGACASAAIEGRSHRRICRSWARFGALFSPNGEIFGFLLPSTARCIGCSSGWWGLRRPRSWRVLGLVLCGCPGAAAGSAGLANQRVSSPPFYLKTSQQLPVMLSSLTTLSLDAPRLIWYRLRDPNERTGAVVCAARAGAPPSTVLDPARDCADD